MPDNKSAASTHPGGPSSAPPSGKRYDAFISYSHAADGQLAPALQRGLQQFARPWRQRRSIEVFRDETGLAVNPDLWESILTALDGSSWFVLLASPRAAQSRWVGQEIEHSIATKGVERLLIVLTDGTLAWDPARGDFTEHSDAAHPALRGLLDREPVIVDMSWARLETDLTNDNERFRVGIAEITAVLRGRPLPVVIEQDERERRRTRRVVRSAVTTLGVLGAAALVAAGLAVVNQRTAADERSTAEAAAAGAEQERAVAEEQAAVALGRELAIRATDVATTSRATPRTARTALALATEAHALAPGVDTAGALLTVVTGIGRETGVVSAPEVLPAGYSGEDVWSSAATRVSLQQDGPGRVVDLDDGTEWELPGSGFFLGPTGEVALGVDGSVVRLEQGGDVRPVVRLPAGVSRPSFSADGERVAYARTAPNADAVAADVVVADLASGESSTFVLDRLGGCSGCEVSVALSPDGDRAVVRGVDGTGENATVWSLHVSALGEPLEQSALVAVAGRGSVRFSDDASQVWLRDGGLLRVLNPATLEDAGPGRSVARGGVLSFVDDDRALISAAGCEPPGLVAAPAMAVVGTLPVATTFTEAGCDPGDSFATWFLGDRWILTDAGTWPATEDALVELACTSLGELSAEQFAGLTGLEKPRVSCQDDA